MPTLSDRILELLYQQEGRTDREITDLLYGKDAPQQPVNQTCRRLEKNGAILREKRKDGLLGNFIQGDKLPNQPTLNPPIHQGESFLSEDAIKETLKKWLSEQKWQVEVSWGHAQGVDILAKRAGQRWIIEVKGQGSLQPMRVNYFLGVLGETLQRMDDDTAAYSIALPDISQFRNLWRRLPSLAKSRTTITAIFVDLDGNVTIEC
jgi:hypothetical protein